MVLGAILNSVLDYALIFGHFGAPAFGVTGAAVATVGSGLFTAVLLFGYTAWTPGLRSSDLYARLWRPDWPAFFDVLRLGWPIGTTIIAGVRLFVAAYVLMGWLGTIHRARHGIPRPERGR